MAYETPVLDILEENRNSPNSYPECAIAIQSNSGVFLKISSQSNAGEAEEVTSR